jgi:membrane dipeptidase
MRSFPVVDGHSDTLLQLMHYFGENPGPKLEWERAVITPDALKEGGVAVQFFAVCTACLVDKDLAAASDAMIGVYDRIVKERADRFQAVRSLEDIKAARESGKVAALLAMEGLEPAGGTLEGIRQLYDRGVRAAALTWSHANPFADGIDEDSGRGVTPLGVEAIAEMERLGMLLDVSHLSVPAFWKAAESVTKPFVATHSNARKLCGHKRNLDDEQLREVARHGGMTGINFFSNFLVNEGLAKMSDVVAHIDYIAGLIGPQHVGIGTDYDGCSPLPEGCVGPRCYPRLAEELLKMNYSESIVFDIFAGNWLRVLEQTVR